MQLIRSVPGNQRTTVRQEHVNPTRGFVFGHRDPNVFAHLFQQRIALVEQVCRRSAIPLGTFQLFVQLRQLLGVAVNIFGALFDLGVSALFQRGQAPGAGVKTIRQRTQGGVDRDSPRRIRRITAQICHGRKHIVH